MYLNAIIRRSRRAPPLTQPALSAGREPEGIKTAPYRFRSRNRCRARSGAECGCRSVRSHQNGEEQREWGPDAPPLSSRSLTATFMPSTRSDKSFSSYSVFVDCVHHHECARAHAFSECARACAHLHSGAASTRGACGGMTVTPDRSRRRQSLAATAESASRNTPANQARNYRRMLSSPSSLRTRGRSCAPSMPRPHQLTAETSESSYCTFPLI